MLFITYIYMMKMLYKKKEKTKTTYILFLKSKK